MIKRIYLLLAIGLFTAVAAWPDENSRVGEPAAMRFSSFHLTVAGGLPESNIRSLYQDSTGYLWLSSPHALYRYDGYHYVRFRRTWKGYSTLLRQVGHWHLHLDSDYLLQVTNDSTGFSQAYMLVTPEQRRQHDDQKIMMIEARDHRIWISTYSNGLFTLNLKNGEMVHITTENSSLLMSNYITFIAEDRRGNIWVCEPYLGLTCIQPYRQRSASVSLPSPVRDLRSQYVRSLHRLDAQTLFAANNYNNAYLLDNQLHVVRQIDTQGNNLLAACYDSTGRLWTGSRLNGVNIDGRWYSHVAGAAGSLSANRVDCILRDRQGRMWLSSFHGGVDLAIADGQSVKFRHFIDGIRGPQGMVLDHRGHIWVAAANGLYTFSPDELVNSPRAYRRYEFGNADGQPCQLLCVAEDSRHRIWAGSAGDGVFWADPSEGGDSLRFHNVTTGDGLVGDVVNLIAEDGRQRVWVGTENGLTVFGADMRMQTLHAPTGPQDCYKESAAALLPDGRMAFGSLDGITVFDASALASGSAPVSTARPVITAVYVNGEALRDSSLAVEELVLGHDQNSLRFTFSCFNYGEQEHTSYQYRLLGYDDRWSPVSRLNEAVFATLPAGHYRLEVRAIDASGLVGPQTIQLPVRIRPHWAATWWARLLFLLAALLLVGGIVRHYWLAYTLRRRIAHEQEVNELKLRFFTDISHEFRTPLTLIAAGMERLKQLPVVPADMKQPMQTMSRSVDRLMRLINQLLEFRKMQNGKLSVRLEPTDVVTLLYNIGQDFYQQREAHHINYQFQRNQRSFTMQTDRGHLDKIAYNLLSNAFKYTPDGGTITLRVTAAPEALTFSVGDTGRGLSPDEQQHLFERYASGRHTADSVGIGLNLTYTLVHLLKGDIRYEQRSEGGSIFTVMLPTDGSLFPEECFVKADQGQKPAEVQVQGFATDYAQLQASPMNDRTVLIVDDDDELRRYVARELGAYFHTEEARDGQEAILLLEDHLPDLVVSDVQMPRVDGFELVRHIRRSSYMYLPVILLTVLSDEQKQLRGLQLGADAYLPKPFSIPLLITQASNLIHQRDSLRIAFAQTVATTPVAPQIVTEERDARFLKTVDAWIDNHLDDPQATLEQLYTSLGYGRSKFFEKFTALTGRPPKEYIRERKMQLAADMLSSDTITVSEVAYKLGFSTPQYLSTCFKAYYGMTPSQYQRGKK